MYFPSLFPLLFPLQKSLVGWYRTKIPNSLHIFRLVFPGKGIIAYLFFTVIPSMSSPLGYNYSKIGWLLTCYPSNIQTRTCRYHFLHYSRLIVDEKRNLPSIPLMPILVQVCRSGQCGNVYCLELNIPGFSKSSF